MKKKIISIQSQIAVGYAGNSIATLAIQLHGLDPIAVPTVLLSNDVDKEVFLGASTPISLFSDLLKGITLNHISTDAEYVISGFCNDTKQIEAIANFISDTKRKQTCHFIYDPVFGDKRVGGLYISKDAADASVKALLALADFVIPNHFELEYLVGKSIDSEAEFIESVEANTYLRDKIIITTGIKLSDTPAKMPEILLYQRGSFKRFLTPELKIQTLGTGDLFTAILVCQLNIGKCIEDAIEFAIQFLHQALCDLLNKNASEFNADTLLRTFRLLQVCE